MDPFLELQSDKEAFKKLVSMEGFPHNEVNYDRYMYAFCAGASLSRKDVQPPYEDVWVEIMEGRLSDITIRSMKKYYAKGVYYGIVKELP